MKYKRFCTQISLFALSVQAVLGNDQDFGFVDDEPGAFALDAMKVQSGQAEWATVGNEFQITASDGALIQYFGGFDIPAGETVRFIQPSSDATVINEIFTDPHFGTVSQIDGNLFANGKVVLFNSAGIVFGETSVVEVGKLHAIAGTDLAGAGLAGYSLDGVVTAAGSITAGEVILAGTSVTHSGTILVDGGALVMTAGAGLQLFNDDLGLSVEVSQESPLTGVSDLAGQALLQSGVVQASKAEFVANAITHSGTTTATSLTVSGFSSFAGGDGTLKASTLTASGSEAVENAPDFSAGGTTNQIAQLTLSGTHGDFTLRSSTGMAEGQAKGEGDDFTTHSVQNLDLRVDDGDLTLNSLFAPTDANSDNSLLLAAENNLNLAGELDLYTHVRKILYGRNLTVGSVTDEEELSLGSTVSLDAISVFMDDLSPTLSPSVIQSLALDNPNFEGFDSQGGLLELSQMTDSQLTTLFKYGLFTGYSYFLQAPDQSAKLADDLAQAGGSSALFGGSFAVVASAGGAGASSSGSSADGGGESDDSSGDGDDGDSDDSSGDEGEGGGGQANASGAGAQARSNGVAPFAPISQPILSVEAAEILEQALSPEIEQRMEQFLKP
jgi:filamentous hemagglutinin family protein